MPKKYEFTDETKLCCGQLVRRIRYANGVLGGFLQSEHNLQQHGECRVLDNAVVMESATVTGDALVTDDAIVRQHATITESARVLGSATRGSAYVAENATIKGNATIHDSCRVEGSAVISGNALLAGNVHVRGSAQVTGNTHLSGHILIEHNAIIKDDANLWAVEHDPDQYDIVVQNDTMLANHTTLSYGVYQSNEDIIHIIQHPFHLTLTAEGVGLTLVIDGARRGFQWCPYSDDAYIVSNALSLLNDHPDLPEHKDAICAICERLVRSATLVAAQTWHTSSAATPADHQKRQRVIELAQPQ